MAQNKVFIIHGWDGYPEEGWFPWLKTSLEKAGSAVFIPAMPDTEKPTIDAWVNFLAMAVGQPDLNTFFVGHSIGCQAILRYLAGLPAGVKVGGAILVAPWMKLDQATIEEEGEEAVAIARPWIETPIDFSKVNTHLNAVTVIFSDNDPFVPLDQAEFFRLELKAKVIIEKNKGHFSGSDNVKVLPSALKELAELEK